MSVKSLFMIPKDLYFQLSSNATSAQGERLSAINVDQVNFTCGPQFAGVKTVHKHASEKEEGKKRMADKAEKTEIVSHHREDSLSFPKTIGRITPASNNTTVAAVAPPNVIKSSVVKTPVSPIKAPSVVKTSVSPIKTPNTPPSIKVQSPAKQQSRNVLSSTLNDGQEEHDNSLEPTTNVGDSVFDASTVIAGKGAEQSIFNSLNETTQNPNRVFSELAKQNRPPLSAPSLAVGSSSAIEEVNSRILSTLSATKNPQEAREITKGLNAGSTPRSVRDLSSSFTDASKKTTNAKKQSASAAASAPKTTVKPVNANKAKTSMGPSSMRTRTADELMAKKARDEKRKQGVRITTPEKKMKTVNYKE